MKTILTKFQNEKSKMSIKENTFVKNNQNKHEAVVKRSTTFLICSSEKTYECNNWCLGSMKCNYESIAKYICCIATCRFSYCTPANCKQAGGHLSTQYWVVTWTIWNDFFFHFQLKFFWKVWNHFVLITFSKTAITIACIEETWCQKIYMVSSKIII